MDSETRTLLRLAVHYKSKERAAKEMYLERSLRATKRIKKVNGRLPYLDTRRVRDRIARRVGEPNHGTYSEYNNYGCRCKECREANTRRNIIKYVKPCIEEGCNNLAWHKPSKHNNGRCNDCRNKNRTKLDLTTAPESAKVP